MGSSGDVSKLVELYLFHVILTLYTIFLDNTCSNNVRFLKCFIHSTYLSGYFDKLNIGDLSFKKTVSKNLIVCRAINKIKWYFP